jgi:hypothetical protein
MSQPRWKFVANLGDRNPLEEGGYFVYVDETGVYTAEAERLEISKCETAAGDLATYEVYRFSLERCTYVNGILSDNKFHPNKPAWWAKPESERAEYPYHTTYLENMLVYTDQPLEEVVKSFCSEDPVERARAYELVGFYHGWINLDSYPIELTYEEALERYTKGEIE